MNPGELQRKLIATVRSHPTSDEVPLGFERRVMIRLASVSFDDPLALWSRGLWRAAIAGLSVSAVAGVLQFSFSHPEVPNVAAEDRDPIEVALLDGIENTAESLW